MIDIKIIEDAYERIRPYLIPTRLEKSLNLSSEDSQVYMKLENEQPLVKAFKVRGVLSKLTSLTEEEIEKTEISAISSGNHGVSLAYCAKKMGIKAPIVFVPTSTPKPKIEKMKKFGANVVCLGDLYDDTHIQGEKIVKENGYIFVDSREDVIGVAGQGSVAIEILQQMPDVDAIIVPRGSGGLSISCGSYLKQRFPHVKLYAVEAANSPALSENLKTGVWTETFQATTPGDPLLKSLVGGCARLTFENAEVIDELLQVNDEEAAMATAEIIRKEKMIIEPDSAVVYAAYKKYSHLFQNKKTVMVFTGANIDDAVFKDIVLNY